MGNSLTGDASRLIAFQGLCAADFSKFVDSRDSILKDTSVLKALLATGSKGGAQ